MPSRLEMEVHLRPGLVADGNKYCRRFCRSIEDVAILHREIIALS